VNRQWVHNVQKTSRIRLAVGGEAFEGEARFLAERAERERAMAAIRREYWIYRPLIALSWVFNSSGAPTGKSLNESMRNFDLQRDTDFTLHVFGDHPRAKSQSTKHDVKQDWEKL
jgi:hypothetical protein